jgi:hypothetical protein
MKRFHVLWVCSLSQCSGPSRRGSKHPRNAGVVGTKLDGTMCNVATGCDVSVTRCQSVQENRTTAHAICPWHSGRAAAAAATP